MDGWHWAIVVLGAASVLQALWILMLMAVIGGQQRSINTQKEITMLLAREVDNALSTHGKNVAGIADFLIKAFDLAKPDSNLKN